MDTKQFDETVEKMRALFSRDYQFALATTSDQGPSLRFVDTYFDGKDFYVVTYTKSRKVMDIEKDPNMCYLKITPTQGFFHFEKTGYKVDFEGKTVTSFPFSFDTVCTEE